MGLNTLGGGIGIESESSLDDISSNPNLITSLFQNDNKIS